MANKIYRNRMIINQRGGSITIDNTTEQEKVNISQRSGSNITMANHVTSELATNNKQTLVINDEFKTVWGNHSDFVGKKRIIRTGEDTLEIKGSLDDEQIAAYEQWKQTYSPIALTNSQFAINRGGYGYPNGVVGDGAGTVGSSVTRQSAPTGGGFAPNPAAKSKIHAVNNDLSKKSNGSPNKVPVGLRTYCTDSVSTYSGVQQNYCAGISVDIGASIFAGISIGAGIGASFGAGAFLRVGICDENGLASIDAGAGAAADINADVDVDIDAGISVSAGVEVVIGAPANLDKNTSTEGGTWSPNQVVLDLPNLILDVQAKLTPIEQRMGNGGDEIKFSKRNNYTQVGATFNDYPSIRIDEHGRSQPASMVVGENGAFGNFTDVPYIEGVDNSSNFPCGNDDATIGNRMTRTVGSGGIALKTTGTLDLGGAKLTTGFKQINMNASHGIQVASEAFVEIQSLKCVTLRCNNQVYVDSSLGVKNNVLVGGGLYVEGELFCQHITAPVEIHQTQDTQCFGGFSCLEDRTMVIGEALIGNTFFPVFALADRDIITMYPHSHHHAGPAMKLIEANAGVRGAAVLAGINSNNSVAQALPQVNERKLPVPMIGDDSAGFV